MNNLKDKIDPIIELVGNSIIEYDFVGSHTDSKSLDAVSHSHKLSFEIILCCNAYGTTKCSNGIFEIQPNTIIFHKANSMHKEHFECEKENIEIYYCGYKTFKQMDTFLLDFTEIKNSPVISITQKQTTTLKTLFLFGIKELLKEKIGYSIISANLFTCILLQSLREMISHYSIKLTPLNAGKINASKIKAEIDAHCFEQDFSLFALSKNLFLSQSNLSKIFAKEFSINPITYIEDKKINYAKKLLVLTNSPNTQIAHILGYKDVINFYRAFKKLTSLTPKQYKLQITYINPN